MNKPGFSAEASLYRSGKYYRQVSMAPGSSATTWSSVVAAQDKRFDGYVQWCLEDCYNRSGFCYQYAVDAYEQCLCDNDLAACRSFCTGEFIPLLYCPLPPLKPIPPYPGAWGESMPRTLHDGPF